MVIHIYTNNYSCSIKTFVGRMTKRFDRSRKGAGRIFCYIGIDVDIKKLQDFIINRKAFYLTLNVINEPTLVMPTAVAWSNNMTATLNGKIN